MFLDILEVTINSLPVITITGATTEVPYDSNAEYTCKVESYPPPNILWKDENGSVLQNKVETTYKLYYAKRNNFYKISL